MYPARSGSLFTVGLLGSIHRGRSHSSSEFLLGFLFSFIFVGQRCFQLRVQSAKWADSPRASSQVNGLSSREFKTRSELTVRMHLRRSTAGPARITNRVHFRSHGGFAFRGDYWSGGSITWLTNIRLRLPCAANKSGSEAIHSTGLHGVLALVSGWRATKIVPLPSVGVLHAGPEV